MMYLYVTLLLAFAVSTGIAAPSRVVNGTDAEEGEFPYIVSLRYNSKHSCGASIVNENFVLTAAHCVNGRVARNISIQYGILEITNDDTNAIGVDYFIVHDEYFPYGGHNNDIAIMKLLSPIPFSENVQPVKLPEQDQEFEDWPTGTLAGWGLPYTNGTVMINLQRVDILVYPFEACQEAHGDAVDPRHHICGGIPEGGKGQCNGDSGGPLTVDGVQVGAVSWSVKPCTVAGYPGVYARVANYIDWINKIVENK